MSPYVNESSNCTYDLYSVINHSGTLNRGHYTSICKNKDDHNWYCYNDSTVNQINTNQIITNEAYVLFYYKNSVDSFERQSEIHQQYNPKRKLKSLFLQVDCNP